MDRVLSYIVDLRRISSLFFIPLEPYPARSARHLPHAGKALPVVILFPHMRVFVLIMREKRYSRFVAFPIGEGGPRQRRSGALVNGALVTPPYCSFCEGRTMALMGEGEVMLGTNNRNFLGRFGSPRAKAYLVNPEVAAASAIAGEIASVR